MARITANDLNIYNIARTIGHATVDLGRLCTSVKNNMWSKYRPVSFNKTEALTVNDRKAVNWGYSMQSYSLSNLGAMLTSLRSVGSGKPCWSNLPPGSGSGQYPYYRIRDFEGYNHDANPPFQWFLRDRDRIIYASEDLHFYQGTDDSDALTKADFQETDFGGIYGSKVGVAIRKLSSSGSPLITCTFEGNTTDFDPNDSDYAIPTTRLITGQQDGGTGSYEFAFFFSPVDKTLDGSMSAGNCLPLPFAYYTFSFENSSGVLVEGDTVVKTSSSFSFVLHMTQNGPVRPIYSVYVYCLKEYSAGGTGWSKQQDGSYIIGSIDDDNIFRNTIGTITTKTYNNTITFAIDGTTWPQDYRIVLNYDLNNTLFWNDGFVEEEIPGV